MTASGIAAAQNVIYPFLAAHFPSFPKPTISENTAAQMDARYFTTSSGIQVPVYSDAWNEGRPDILIHETGHWVAYHTDDPYPKFLIAMGGNPALYGDPLIGEMFAEHFVRAYVPTYDGRNYPQLVGRVPFDADKMRAFAESLTPASAGAPKVVAAVGAPRKMYDSTTAADIPADATMVAGYIDGAYEWSAADWARFPDAVKVRIAIRAVTDDGIVGDVEWGDMTPDEVPGWVSMRRRAGADPTIYCNRSNWQACKDACDRDGVAYPHWWLAAYGVGEQVLDGTVATQYANEAITGAHYDLSAVAPYWPGVDGGADMTPEDVKATVESTYDLSNTITALKSNDAHVADVLRKAAAALIAAADELTK